MRKEHSNKPIIIHYNEIGIGPRLRVTMSEQH